MTNVSAGIVLYNPDISRLRENINAILPQVDFIVLVDNASQNIKKVESMYCNFDNIFFIKNKKNLGVATALNQIVKFCETKNVKWVLTLSFLLCSTFL
jgi:rhamnosyltransferase